MICTRRRSVRKSLDAAVANELRPPHSVCVAVVRAPRLNAKGKSGISLCVFFILSLAVAVAVFFSYF